MKTLTLRKDFFTTFAHISILCLRNQESSQEQGISLLIVAASESYLIINSGIKAAAVPNMPSVKVADGGMSIKKEKISS